MLVGVHHDIHKVWVVEGRSRLRKGGVAERPVGRPLTPKQAAELLAVPCQAIAPTPALK